MSRAACAVTVRAVNAMMGVVAVGSAIGVGTPPNVQGMFGSVDPPGCRTPARMQFGMKK